MLNDLRWMMMFQSYCTKRLIDALEMQGKFTIGRFQSPVDKAAYIAKALQTERGCASLQAQLLTPWKVDTIYHKKVEREVSFIDLTIGWWIVLWRISNWKRDHEQRFTELLKHKEVGRA